MPTQKLYEHYRASPPTGRGYRLAEWYWRGRRGVTVRPTSGTLCEAAYLAGLATRREAKTEGAP